jgi:hypothetical protein
VFLREPEVDAFHVEDVVAGESADGVLVLERVKANYAVGVISVARHTMLRSQTTQGGRSERMAIGVMQGIVCLPDDKATRPVERRF